MINAFNVIVLMMECLCGRQGHSYENGEKLGNGIVPRKCKYCGHKYCCGQDGGHQYEKDSSQCMYCGDQDEQRKKQCKQTFYLFIYLF